MVAARRGDDPPHIRPLALEPVEIDNAAAHLEGADGRVVLVLDDDLDAGHRLEQRPGILWGRRHARADQRDDGLKLGQAEHSGLNSLWFEASIQPRPARRRSGGHEWSKRSVPNCAPLNL
jgi:hypothetical protein